MDLPFKPKLVRRPREQVETQIREAIISGLFRQGEKLPSETQLAEKFGVSRTTVREALRSLATSGMIAKVPGVGGGSFVQSIDHHTLSSALADSLVNVMRLGSISRDEVDHLRRILEVPAAMLAAQNRNELDLELLDRILARERSTTIDDPAVPDLDINFHEVIAEASKNRLLASLVAALHHVIRPASSLRLSPEIGRSTVLQHRAIIVAIQAQDAETAGQAMEEHLDYLSSLNTSTGSPTAMPSWSSHEL